MPFTIVALAAADCCKAWSKQGIVGRGVLLDYHAWRLRHGIAYEAFETGNIRLDHLKETAKEQGIEIKFGDILVIRSGE